MPIPDASPAGPSFSPLTVFVAISSLSLILRRRYSAAFVEDPRSRQPGS